MSATIFATIFQRTIVKPKWVGALLPWILPMWRAPSSWGGWCGNCMAWRMRIWSPAELSTSREDIYIQGVSGKNAHIQRKCGPELTDYLFNVTKKEKGSSSSREYIYASKSNVLISDNHTPLLWIFCLVGVKCSKLIVIINSGSF